MTQHMAIESGAGFDSMDFDLNKSTNQSSKDVPSTQIITRNHMKPLPLAFISAVSLVQYFLRRVTYLELHADVSYFDCLFEGPFMSP